MLLLITRNFPRPLNPTLQVPMLVLITWPIILVSPIDTLAIDTIYLVVEHNPSTCIQYGPIERCLVRTLLPIKVQRQIGKIGFMPIDVRTDIDSSSIAFIRSVILIDYGPSGGPQTHQQSSANHDQTLLGYMRPSQTAAVSETPRPATSAYQRFPSYPYEREYTTEVRKAGINLTFPGE